VAHVDHPNIKFEAMDVAVERCFEVLFEVPELVQGFFNA